MKPQEIAVQVNCELTPTQETVERCLKIVEWWLNDNPDMRIRGGYRDGDGKIDPLFIERIDSKI